jgi:sugar O-acyltransferase (sialic acid O-acetyltransferase NeuD family)
MQSGDNAQLRSSARSEGGDSLFLAGSGSFAIEVGEWASDAGWRVLGLIELLDPARIGSSVSGLPVVGADAPLGGAVVAAGGSRAEHWSRLAGSWEPVAVTHPRAHVSRSATVAPGCVVGPGAVVGAKSGIGAHTLVSRGALVGHHCHIGEFVSLMPGANLGGHTEIGDRSVVGMGATILNGTLVGADVTVAAGAVVVDDVRDGTRVQGVPAREYHA